VNESVIKSIEKSTVVKDRDVTSKVGKSNDSAVVSEKSAVDDNPKVSKVSNESNKAAVVAPVIDNVLVATETDKETEPVVVADVKAPVVAAVESVVEKDNPKVTSKVSDESVKALVIKESVKVPVVNKSVKASSVVTDRPSIENQDKIDVVVKKSVKSSSVVADKPSSVVVDKVDVFADKASDALKNKLGRKVISSEIPVLRLSKQEENPKVKAKVNVKRKIILSKEDDRKKKLKGKSKKDVSDFGLETDVVDYYSDEADQKRKKLKIKAGLKRKRSGSDSSEIDTKSIKRLISKLEKKVKKQESDEDSVPKKVKKKLTKKVEKEVPDEESLPKKGNKKLTKKVKKEESDKDSIPKKGKKKEKKLTPKEAAHEEYLSSFPSFHARTTPSSLFSAIKNSRVDILRFLTDIGFSDKIEVTPSKIHDMLGVPFGGYSLYDLDEREADHEFVRKWAGQFYPLELKKVCVNDIAQKLIVAQEIDFLFKVNFLTLFTNTMGKADGLKGHICLDLVRRLREDSEDDRKKELKGKSKKDVSDSELETDVVDYSSDEADRKRKKLKIKAGLKRKRNGSDSSDSSEIDTKSIKLLISKLEKKVKKQESGEDSVPKKVKKKLTKKVEKEVSDEESLPKKGNKKLTKKVKKEESDDDSIPKKGKKKEKQLTPKEAAHEEYLSSFPSFYARTTPSSFFSAIKNSRVDILRFFTDIGFSSLHNVFIDHLSSKLGWFAVSKFKSYMLIFVLGDKIEVTLSKIHDMLGVPFGGYSLFDLDEKETDHEFVRKWAGQFYALELKKVRVNDIAQKLIAAQEIDFLFKILYLDSMKFDKFLVVRTRLAIRNWSSYLMKQRQELELKDHVVGLLDLHDEWNEAEVQESEGFIGFSETSEKEVCDLIKKAEEKLSLICVERVILEDYMRKASLKCPGDGKFVALHEKYVNLFKDTISFEDDRNGDNVGDDDDENGNDDAGNVDNDANDCDGNGDEENGDLFGNNSATLEAMNQEITPEKLPTQEGSPSPKKRAVKPSSYLLSPYMNKKTNVVPKITRLEFILGNSLFAMQGDKILTKTTAMTILDNSPGTYDSKYKEVCDLLTKENFHDCEIFTMLYMKTFDGGPALNLDCGLPVESQLQRDMLRRLRFKFAMKILLHEINVHAGKMLELAKDFDKTDPVEKMAIIVDAFKKKEEHNLIMVELIWSSLRMVELLMHSRKGRNSDYGRTNLEQSENVIAVRMSRDSRTKTTAMTILDNNPGTYDSKYKEVCDLLKKLFARHLKQYGHIRHTQMLELAKEFDKTDPVEKMAIIVDAFKKKEELV
nr:hypothetical protein [Tanacetum cinerariifolium]